MGLALSKRLAMDGHRVIMLCRNNQRGKTALQTIRAEVPGSNPELAICDLASLDDIRRFCGDFLTRHSRLDVLVNNAGVILPGRHETLDGFELQFGVNYLGHFLLTNLLLPALKPKGGGPVGRIIIVSSGAHSIGRMYWDDLQLEEHFTVIRAYSRSKLANLLFGYELDRRLEGKGPWVTMLHPGAVATNMGINRETGFGKGITRLLKPFFKTPCQGADTAYYLATSPEVEGISGRYFVNRREKRPAKRALDPKDAAHLWRLSEELTGLAT